MSYENDLNYPVYVSDQKCENCMDLLSISNESKSYYVYIKDFIRFMCNKTKSKNKNYFCKCCLPCFSCEKILIEHKKICLVVNCKQTVKLKSGSVRLKSYFQQLAVPFEIYADFECLLKGVQSSKKIIVHTLKNIKIIFLVVLLVKLFVLIIKSVKKMCFLGERMQFIDSLKQFMKSIIILKK